MKDWGRRMKDPGFWGNLKIRKKFSKLIFNYSKNEIEKNEIGGKN